MTPKLSSARYVRDYRIHVRFADGREGEIDFEPELWGDVFEPLKDLAVFRGFQVSEELNTISWPNGADFAPEFLYDAVNQPGATDSQRRRASG